MLAAVTVRAGFLDCVTQFCLKTNICYTVRISHIHMSIAKYCLPICHLYIFRIVKIIKTNQYHFLETRLQAVIISKRV